MKRQLKQISKIPGRAVRNEGLTSVEAAMFYLFLFSMVCLLCFMIWYNYPNFFKETLN